MWNWLTDAVHLLSVLFNLYYVNEYLKCIAVFQVHIKQHVCIEIIQNLRWMKTAACEHSVHHINNNSSSNPSKYLSSSFLILISTGPFCTSRLVFSSSILGLWTVFFLCGMSPESLYWKSERVVSFSMSLGVTVQILKACLNLLLASILEICQMFFFFFSLYDEFLMMMLFRFCFVCALFFDYCRNHAGQFWHILMNSLLCLLCPVLIWYT